MLLGRVSRAFGTLVPLRGSQKSEVLMGEALKILSLVGYFRPSALALFWQSRIDSCNEKKK